MTTISRCSYSTSLHLHEQLPKARLCPRRQFPAVVPYRALHRREVLAARRRQSSCLRDRCTAHLSAARLCLGPWRVASGSPRHPDVLHSFARSRKHYRKCGRHDRFSLRPLLLHRAHGPETLSRADSARTRLPRHGLHLLDPGSLDLREKQRAKYLDWISRSRAAFGGQFPDGRVGPSPGSGVVPHFGVPVSNFLGWYLGVYIFYQLFVLYLRRRSAILNPLPLRQWQMAVLFYSVCAAGNLLLLLGAPPGGLAVVSDPSGARWNVRDIVGASALVSIFTMGAFALLAWVRLAEQTEEAPSP
jgi:hypothetical protein